MKIVHTSAGPAIMDDDGEVLLPTDPPAIYRALQKDARAVGELIGALAVDVAAMLPVADLLKADPTEESPSQSDVLMKGLRAAESLVRVAQVCAVDDQ